MSEHFIKEIEIKNYKLFKDFKASGFGRVNLIGGKNNVGKTAFMEACWIHCYGKSTEKMSVALASVTTQRELLEYVGKELTKDVFQKNLERNASFHVKSNLHETFFKVYQENGEKNYQFLFANHNIDINANKFNYDIQSSDSLYFISSFGVSNKKLKTLYEVVQIQDKEELLYQFINQFDKNILNFKIIGGDKPKCKVSDGVYIDINEFGDGLKHYISIICALYAYKNGYLYIDEIGNGIHYTNYDKLWEIILTISKEQNVQVFATTHSKELIESYARVAKRLEEDDITFMSMYREDENIKSIILDNKSFIQRVELGLENR